MHKPEPVQPESKSRVSVVEAKQRLNLCLAERCGIDCGIGEYLCREHWLQAHPDARREVVRARNALRGSRDVKVLKRFKFAWGQAVAAVNEGLPLMMREVEDGDTK